LEKPALQEKVTISIPPEQRWEFHNPAASARRITQARSRSMLECRKLHSRGIPTKVRADATGALAASLG
jgi:hypothetical protein